MANYYTINNVTASLSPTRQSAWQRNKIGTDHNGAPIFGRKRQVQLDFTFGTPASMKQWLDVCNGSPQNLDILADSQLSWKSVSSVYLECIQYPIMEDITANTMTIMITNLNP
jgi:hypothetical protein